MKLESLKQLYLDELRDAYSAEDQITKALPKMIDAASSSQLSSAFQEHLDQTKRQMERLEKIFAMHSESPKGKTCKGMEGIIKEGEEFIKSRGDDATRDAALISAAQRVEHYEIAAYGTLRTYARMLNDTEAVTLLQQTLDEESNTDEKLTRLAESSINQQAKAAGR